MAAKSPPQVEDLKFDDFCKVCDAISRQGGKGRTKEKQRQVLEKVWKTFLGQNMYPIVRLLIPNLDEERGTYGVREKTIGPILIDVLGISKMSSDGKRILNYKNPRFAQSGNAGDLVAVIEQVAESRLPKRGSGNKKDLTVGEINALLDELYKADNKLNRSIFMKLVPQLCGRELFWVCRIILKDMKMGMRHETILKHFHKNAMDIYNISSSLRKVCECVIDEKKMNMELNKLTVFSPCQLMLCANVQWTNIITEMRGHEFAVEPKYDGVRLTIHYDGNEFKLFTRNSQDYTNRYCFSIALRDQILDGLRNFSSCIIDGELVAWDPENKCYREFGSNRTIALYEGKQIMASKAGESKGTENPGEYADWTCEQCGFTNAQQFQTCFRCQVPKEKNERREAKRGGVGGGGGATERPQEARGQLCYQVFDILMQDGESVIDKPYRARREILLQKIVQQEKRFEVIEQTLGLTNIEQIMAQLDQSIVDKYEGVVIKDLDSKYELGKRSSRWLKLKADHVDGMMDDLDIVILGGYFGDGTRQRAGTISHFLMGVRGRPKNLTGIPEVKHTKMRGRDASYPDDAQPTPFIAPVLEDSETKELTGPTWIDSGDDANSTKWSTLCKVGTGYRVDQLTELRSRLNLVPNDNKTRYPSYLIDDTKLEPDDRPDVWVRDPEQSVVLQVHCYEITECRWDKFRAKFTLRFPRCKAIRYDKPVSEAMTWSQFFKFVVDMRRNRTRGFGGAVSAQLANDEPRRRKGKKRKKSVTVGELHQATDVSEIKVESTILQGNGQPLEFCILSIEPGSNKAELEREIKKHGGAFTQNPLESTDYILAGPKTFRVTSQIKKGETDIIHHSWLTDCIAAGGILPLQLRHVIYASESTQADLDRRMDEYGDLYSVDCTPESLRDIFSRMQSRKRTKTAGKPSRMRDFMEEEEALKLQSSFSVFSRCRVYVDMYYKPCSVDTLIHHSPLGAYATKIRMYGGVVDSAVGPKTTHVIVDDTKYQHAKGKKMYGALSFKKNILEVLKKLRERSGTNAKPHFVSRAWVDQSILMASQAAESEYPAVYRS